MTLYIDQLMKLNRINKCIIFGNEIFDWNLLEIILKRLKAFYLMICTSDRTPRISRRTTVHEIFQLGSYSGQLLRSLSQGCWLATYITCYS